MTKISATINSSRLRPVERRRFLYSGAELFAGSPRRKSCYAGPGTMEGISMRFLILGAALGVALAACAATASASENAITPGQTLSKMGECMTVEGQVSLRPSTNRFGANLSFQSGNGFTGYIPEMASLGDLSRYDGQTVDLTGVIEPGQDGSAALIRVTSPEQLMLADETPDRLLTCDRF
jgi:hypothetical protein